MKFERLALLLAMALIFSGCARGGETTLKKAEFYPQCQAPLEDSAKHGPNLSGVGEGMVTGGMIAGLSSVLLGVFSGNFRGGSVAVATGVGAAVGGTVGGLNSAGRGSRESNKKLAEYLEQIDGDIEGIDTVEKAAGTLALQCYNKNFHTLLGDMKAGKLDQEAAKARFAEIVSGSEMAAKMAGKPSETQEFEQEFSAASRP